MNRESFFNKHQHSRLRREELERKYRVYLREQEELALIEQLSLAQQQANYNATVNGAGSGGTSSFENDYVDDGYVDLDYVD